MDIHECNPDSAFPSTDDDSQSFNKRKIISMDEYKKRRALSAEPQNAEILQDADGKSDSSEIVRENEESSVETSPGGPESVTWKLLHVKHRGPAIYQSSVYVLQDSPNRAITMIPTEKSPLDKISLSAFRDLPLPSHRSTVIATTQASPTDSLDIDFDDDILAGLAEMLNFQKDSPKTPEELVHGSSRLYNNIVMPDSQSAYDTDDNHSQEIVRENESWRYCDRSSAKRSSRFHTEQTTRSKRKKDRTSETECSDRKRRKRNSDSDKHGYSPTHRHRRDSSFDGERYDNLYEMMLRAKRDHDTREQRRRASEIENRNPVMNYRSRIPSMKKPYWRQLGDARPPRFRNGFTRSITYQNNYSQNNRRRSPCARGPRRGPSRRYHKPYSTR